MLVIVNPAAAGGRLGREWPRRSASLNHDSRVVWTEAPGHATELARAAVRDGHRRIVAAGGDGTVCEAAEGMPRDGDASLGILPLGTGNDIARTLGVPTDFAEACANLVDGVSRRADLIRVDDRLVVNAIGIGLTGDINRRAAGIKRVRGMTAYLVAALAGIVRYPSPRLRMVSPAGEWQGHITMVAVHNGPTTGGGFRLTPGASPWDGRLNACLVPGVGPMARLPRLAAAVRGTLGRYPDTVELCQPWLELEHEAPLPAHLDGNQTWFKGPRTRFETVPEALGVLVPRHA
jgi:YegS/Rv2252/BmrU family lipid kinase